jgi:protein involved in polysaccharide export with SLBB domain
MKTNALIWMLLLVAGALLTAAEVPTNLLIPISVSVTGDVPNPGVYVLTTTNRVSDAIMYAQMSQTLANQQLKSVNPALEAAKNKFTIEQDSVEVEVFQQRNIILNRQGMSQELDLLLFYRTGEISQNPFLKDGDVIFVTPLRSTISISGSVVKPGDYEFRQGDTIGSLLTLALGTKEDADLKRVMLYRYQDNYTDFDKTEINLSGLQDKQAAAASQSLQPGDRIIVPGNSEYRKAYKVLVSGKVKMPGEYYVNAKTTLYDLLVMCGGPTAEADLDGAYLYNRLLSGEFDPDFERLKLMYMTQMTWMEYSYLRTKVRQLKGKYSVDIKAAWNSEGSTANQFLRDGDELIVPEAYNAIWVTGQVKHPGILAFKEGMTWKEYIAAAGGYTNNRKFMGVRIIRAYSGNWVKPTDEIILRPGDTIFISEKEEVTVWAEIKDVLLMASQVVTIILAIRSFTL